MSLVRGAALSLATQGAKQVVLRLADRIQTGELRAVLPDGSLRVYGRAADGPRASISVHHDDFFRRALLGGEVGFGEAYVDGLYSSDDLVALLMLGIRNRQCLQTDTWWLTRASRLRDMRLHRGRPNSRDGARENIHAHYDLGNEFFAFWLDETMTYSCAQFRCEGDSLADAQRNKYRSLCEKAGIRPGDHVLEIGSGWGGFAMFAAQHYGCRVTSITISREQHALARRRISDAGLTDAVDIQLCDYRDLDGAYDRIVSIEMFEALGAEYFATYFDSCDRALRAGGTMVLQTISVPDRAYAALRDGVNWVQKYIFPGGMLPSLAEIERSLAGTRLLISGVEDIGMQYAPTLRAWRTRFLARADEVRALGFDDRFIRMWEYYLAVSEAGFITRNTGDLQIVLDKP